MATELIMPKVTQTMDAGSVVRWLRAEGDPVEKGEILYEVETDKASVEIESPASGILGRILAETNVRIPVGQVIAYIVGPGEPIPGGTPDPGPVASSPMPGVAPSIAHVSAEPAMDTEDRTRISPLARRLALENGIDLAALKGICPSGRITKEHVDQILKERTGTAALERDIPSAPEPELCEKLIPLTPMRAAIAEQMTRSAREVPRITEVIEIDATEVVRLRTQLLPEVEKRMGVRLSVTHIIIKGVAQALQDHPALNSQWAGTGIRMLKAINVGMAVALDDGLIVPVIRGANQKPLMQVAQAAAQLALRARQRKLTQEELTGGTFTVSNLGMYGVDAFTPIVNLPESAILGVGRLVERPVFLNGEVKGRWLMQLSLTFDHRVSDGAQAARFLSRLRDILESPLQLLLPAS